MDRLPDLVTPMDHALAYASIVARDAQQVPREWLQAGIGRGAIGAYPDDGRAWVYVEAQTTTGYQLTEIAPATAGVPVDLSFTGGGSAWTVAIDGKQAYHRGSRHAGDRDVDRGRGVPGDATAARVRGSTSRSTASSPWAIPAACFRSSTRRPTDGPCVWGSVRASEEAASTRRLRDVGSDDAAG